MIAQIYRILKPGGICYFAGPNLLYPIEPHVHWPFIHWIPRRLTLAILTSLAPNKVLDAYSTTYWRLRRWLGKFVIVGAVPDLIKNRAESSGAGNVWATLKYGDAGHGYYLVSLDANGAEKRAGATQAVVLYVPGETHGSDWLCMETLIEACRDREVSIPRTQAYLGELARNQRDQFAGANGVGRLEVVRDGSAVCTLGTGAFIGCGSTN